MIVPMITMPAAPAVAERVAALEELLTGDAVTRQDLSRSTTVQVFDGVVRPRWLRKDRDDQRPITPAELHRALTLAYLGHLGLEREAA